MKSFFARVRPHAVMLAISAALVAPATSSAAPKSGTDWLWLSSWESAPCTFTAKVDWAGFRQGRTLQVFATHTYFGSPLVPTSVRVQNKGGGTATVTLPALASSAVLDYFYVWAQLLDSHDVPIPSSLDFASLMPVYCAAP